MDGRRLRGDGSVLLAAISLIFAFLLAAKTRSVWLGTGMGALGVVAGGGWRLLLARDIRIRTALLLGLSATALVVGLIVRPIEFGRRPSPARGALLPCPPDGRGGRMLATLQPRRVDEPLAGVVMEKPPGHRAGARFLQKGNADNVQH